MQYNSKLILPVLDLEKISEKKQKFTNKSALPASHFV